MNVRSANTQLWKLENTWERFPRKSRKSEQICGSAVSCCEQGAITVPSVVLGDKCTAPLKSFVAENQTQFQQANPHSQSEGLWTGQEGS